MRKSIFPIALVLALLAGCVTINVYFPAAAAQKAADKVISNIMGPADAEPATSAPASSAQPPASAGGNGHAAAEPLAMRVLDAVIPAANAAEPANLDIQSPAIAAIEARMRSRFNSTLKGLLDSGAVGFTHNGDVAIHDASKIALPARAQANQAVAAENADRAALYKQIGVANGHPEWTQSMREAFAKRWISRAQKSGWYYKNAAGAWSK